MQLRQKLGILGIIIFFPTINLFAKPLTESEQRSLRNILASFVGTYVVHDTSGGEKIASIFIRGNRLELWELSGNPAMIWHDFQYPLGANELLPRKNTEYHAEPGLLELSEISVDREGRHILEKRRLYQEGEELYFSLERKFLRQNLFNRVQNLFVENVKKDIHVRTRRYIKQSRAPLLVEEMVQLAQARNAIFLEEVGTVSQCEKIFED